MSYTIQSHNNKLANNINLVTVETTDNPLNHICELNVLYNNYQVDTSTSNSANPQAIGNNVYTRLNVPGHTYKENTYVLIDDSTTNYSGIFRIVQVETDYITIDLIPITVPSLNDVINIYEVQTFDQPFINDKAIFNLQDLLKYKVSIPSLTTLIQHQPLIDSYNSSYLVPTNTKLDYALSVNTYFTLNERFIDNAFVTGNKVGFIMEDNTTRLNVGDKISIKQDLLEWYPTYYNSNNGQIRLGHNSIQHNYRVGQSVTIAQHPLTSLNGTYNIVAITPLTITLDYTYTGTQVNSGGYTYANARPEYDGFATVTLIENHLTLGIIVHTDKVGTGSSRPIGGYITYANSAQYPNYNELFVNNQSVYYGTTPKFDNGGLEINNVTTKFNKAITNLKPNTVYEVNDSPIYLLVYNQLPQPPNTAEARVNVYDKSGVLLYTTAYYGWQQSTYVDMSWQSIKLLLSPTTIDETYYYNVEVVYSGNVQETYYFKPLKCKKNNISLVFADDLGSYVHLPFNQRVYKGKQRIDSSYLTREYSVDNNLPVYKSSKVNYHTETATIYTINSNWFTDEQSQLLQTAISNNLNVWLDIDNILIPATIVTDELFIKDTKNDKLFQYEIEVQINTQSRV